MPMSRREGRDSGSNRRHSRFDREPSLKRFRKDGIQERERKRVTRSANLDNADHVDRDQKHHRRLHDALPLESPLAYDSKQEAGAAKKDSDKKRSDHCEAPKLSDPTEVPRSCSDFQHDERGSARQVGPSSGRRAIGERGWWKDSRDQHNERAETTNSREQRDEKSQAKPDDNTFQRKDGPSERKDNPLPTSKKRPAFKENNIPVDLGDANPAATQTVKSSQTDHLPERSEKREERSSNPRHFDRPEKQYAGDRAPNKGEARRDGFSLRGRYGGSARSSNYRERDGFIGRQGYRPSKIRTEKWKHDMYQEVNMDPIQKNEDDQIAKLEELLAS